MAYDGSGNFLRIHNWVADATAGIKILASRHDAEDANLASGLSNVICKDGQSSPVADIGFNGKKIINLANGVSPQDAVTLNQLQAIRTFSTGIVISGSTINGMISFTGATTPTGLSWATAGPANAAGMFFGVNADSWVWNDKPDGTGTDVMGLTETATLTLKSLDPGAAQAPNLILNRASPSPAANDVLGTIQFMGKNSVAADVNYGQIYQQIVDPVSGSEDANMYFGIQVAGAYATRLSLTATGVTVNSGCIDPGVGNLLLGGGSGPIYFRPYGSTNATNQCYIDTGGNYTGTGNFTTGGSGVFKGSVVDIWAVGGGNAHVYYKNAAGGTAVIAYWNQAGGLYNVTVGSSPFIYTAAGAAQKPGGGSWADSSDQRIKTVLGDYESGLDAVKALKPIRYTYRGNDTHTAPSNYADTDQDAPPLEERGTPTAPYANSTHYGVAVDAKEFIGLVAQEVEPVMPEMVSDSNSFIDGIEVTDLKNLDTGPLIFALVNAVKELSAKVEALEAAR